MEKNTKTARVAACRLNVMRKGEGLMLMDRSIQCIVHVVIKTDHSLILT